MRPDFDPKEIEAAVGKIEQHRLIRQAWSAVPTDPRRQVVYAQGEGHQRPFQIAEIARNTFGKDRLARGVEGRLIL